MLPPAEQARDSVCSVASGIDDDQRSGRHRRGDCRSPSGSCTGLGACSQADPQRRASRARCCSRDRAGASARAHVSFELDDSARAARAVAYPSFPQPGEARAAEIAVTSVGGAQRHTHREVIVCSTGQDELTAALLLRHEREHHVTLWQSSEKDDTQQRPGATPAHNFAYARPTLATTSTAPTSASALSPPQNLGTGCRSGRLEIESRSTERPEPSRSDASGFVKGEASP